MSLKFASGTDKILISSKLSSCHKILLQFSIKSLSLDIDLLHLFGAYLSLFSLAEILVALDVALIGAKSLESLAWNPDVKAKKFQI